MEKLRSFLVSVTIDGPQREKSIVVFANNIEEVEAKLNTPLLRIKIMDWVPIPSENKEIDDGSRYILADYKKDMYDKEENPKLFVLKVKTFSDVDTIIRKKFERKLNNSELLQGIETLDLEVLE